MNQTDPRTAVLSAMAYPPYNETAEERCTPWAEAERLLDAYRDAVLAEVAAQPPEKEPAAPHGLSVQHADALWDAVAIPGPTRPTFPEQHERVCRAVAEIINEVTPVVSPPTDRAALLDIAAQAIRDSNGTPEALVWWEQHPQLIPAHVYAAAVLAVLGEQSDRAAVLLWAANHFDRMGRTVLAASQVRDELRRLAVEAQQQQPCAECDHPADVHQDGEDPVSPGTCTACNDDERWHDYQPAHGAEAQQQPDTETPADRGALRDRIAEALMCWAEGNNSPKYASMRRPEIVRQNAYSRADAVLAVLPGPPEQATKTQQPAACGAREPEPRTGTSPCVLPAGHGGDRHQDKWTNQWPAGQQPAAADDEETRRG